VISAPGTKGGGAALPFDRLDLADARLTFRTTATGEPAATASLDATVTPGADGVVSGHAIIDGVVAAAGEAPVHITVDLPDWHLVND
jgi:hypothetical protein